MAKKKRSKGDVYYVPLPADSLGHIAATPDFKSRVKQSFKQQCDVNFIMAQFRKTGQLPFSTQKPVFTDGRLLSMSLAERITAARSADALFDSLPASLRDAAKNAAGLASMTEQQILSVLQPPATPPATPPAAPPASPPSPSSPPSS